MFLKEPMKLGSRPSAEDSSVEHRAQSARFFVCAVSFRAAYRTDGSIAGPLSTDTDLAAARALLKNSEELKRARSILAYWRKINNKER